ncbi:MAG: hypothetical protein MK116_00430 [Phycisphaerales bacterium]|nr:hypothetical protein [Phycisphaerales bacterium]
MGDWQFWVVTVLAAGAALVLLRPLFSRLKTGRTARSSRASLTVEGRQVRQSRRSSADNG